jgi:hypothetical protein
MESWQRAGLFLNLKIIQRIARPRLSDGLNEIRMGDTDYDLVLQSQNGDPAAFETLIRNLNA